MRYVHTNITSKDWRKLADFYINVFSCRIKPPERYLTGAWLSRGTGVSNAAIQGVHLYLPGYETHPVQPTLEILQYSQYEQKLKGIPNRLGYGHIAFEVDDIYMVLDQIVLHGGLALGQISEIMIEGVGTLFFVYATDPENNCIELQTWK